MNASLIVFQFEPGSPVLFGLESPVQFGLESPFLFRLESPVQFEPESPFLFRLEDSVFSCTIRIDKKPNMDSVYNPESILIK